MKIKVKSVAHHRNGIGGNGFYAVLFKHTGKELRESDSVMLGIVFDEPASVAVIDVEGAAMGDIAFGSNSWRGDRYEPALREACKAYEASRA